MSVRQRTMIIVVVGMLATAAAWAVYAQAASKTYNATATVKTAGGATASAPVTITIDRTMSQDEAGRLVAAFDAGGPAGFREALAGVPPTGSVRLGTGTPTPARVTIERMTDAGRLLTIVTDKPLVFLGAGLPEAAPKAGYDFAVIDLTVDADGKGSGVLAPAATITAKQGVFVVQDYAAELVRLTVGGKMQ